MENLKITIQDGRITALEYVESYPDDAVECMLPYEPQGKVDVYIDKSGTLRHKPYNG